MHRAVHLSKMRALLRVPPPALVDGEVPAPAGPFRATAADGGGLAAALAVAGVVGVGELGVGVRVMAMVVVVARTTRLRIRGIGGLAGVKRCRSAGRIVERVRAEGERSSVRVMGPLVAT